jgi:hypothetical protein
MTSIEPFCFANIREKIAWLRERFNLLFFWSLNCFSFQFDHFIWSFFIRLDLIFFLLSKYGDPIMSKKTFKPYLMVDFAK